MRALVLCALVSALPALGQWNLYGPLSSSPYSDHVPTLSRGGEDDSLGAIVLAWTRYNAWGGSDVRARMSSDDSTTWGDEQPVTADSFFNYEPTAISGHGLVLLVYVRDSMEVRDVLWTRRTAQDTAWPAARPLTSDVAVDESPTLCLLDSSHAAALWIRDQNVVASLYGFSPEPQPWSNVITVSESPFWEGDVAATGRPLADGRVVAVWEQLTPERSAIVYSESYPPYITWSAPTAATSDTADEWYPDVDDTTLVYLRARGGGEYDLYTCALSDTTWSQPTLLAADVSGQSPPHVARPFTTFQIGQGPAAEVYVVMAQGGSQPVCPMAGEDRHPVITRRYIGEFPIDTRLDFWTIVWEHDAGGQFDIYGAWNAVVKTPDEPSAPNRVALSARPNPFNPTTTLSFELPSAGAVELCLFDVLGRKVETLVSGNLPAGKHSIEWNAERFASGVYFARLTAMGETRTIKLTLLK